MRKEQGRLPCFENPERVCDCPLREINAIYINNLGNKERSLRYQIQHEGYDRVTSGLIVELIKHPFGGYYTEAFEDKLEFSPKMREIRQKILKVWREDVELISQRNPNLVCPELKKNSTG